ncbi:hypothetical protein JXA34_03540 [Patescibacteria group bacterium]|nr:hypothetical protein [Patescibacteria group bacterium]
MKISEVTHKLGLTAAPKDPSDTAPEFPASYEQPLGPRKVLMEWTEMSRPEMKQLDPKVSKTLNVIGGFFLVLLLLMKEFPLILVIVSMMLIARTLRQIPPEKVNYEISNHGIKFNEFLYRWDELESYFIKDSSEMHVMVVATKVPIPGRVYLTYKNKDEEKLIDLLGEYLIYIEGEPKTKLDHWYEKAIGKLDLDR